MKVIIAGSRTIKSEKEVLKALKDSGIKPSEITEIVCGDAQGPDIIGAEIARKKKIKVTHFPADWQRDGKKAGYIRNVLMSRYADFLIDVWDGVSNGSRHMISVMEKAGKPMHVRTVPMSYYICNTRTKLHCKTECLHGMRPHLSDKCTKMEFCQITKKFVKCRKISMKEIQKRASEWNWGDIK